MADKNVATGIDEDVNIPAAVRASTEAANRMIEEQRRIAAGEPLEGDDPDGGTQPQPKEEPEQPQGTYRPKPNDPDDPQDDTWRQKFLSEQGRSQAFQRQISAMTADIDDLRRQIEEKKSEPAPRKRLINDEEQAEYGEDFMDVVGRRAQEIADEQTAPLRQQLAELTRKVASTESVTFTTKMDKFEDALNKRVPNWVEINADPMWIAWLGEVDPIAGQERQLVLDKASQAFDAARVAALFEAYARDVGVTIPSSSPTPQAQQPQPKAKLNLGDLVAPGTSRQQASAPAESAETWIKASDIKAFYDDVSRGRYRGNEAEQAETEKLIQEASRNNRVIQNQ